MGVWGGMNLVVFGLSITSGWANGHAALYRELLSGWVQQGHSALFLERTQPWYGRRRDLAGSGFCRVAQYSDLRDLRKWAKEVARADGGHVGEGCGADAPSGGSPCRRCR
jgi:hypothetical protein